MVLSLRARVTLALSTIALALLIASAVAIGALTRLGGAVGTILRENYVSVIAANDMSESLERLDSAALFAASGQRELAGSLLGPHRTLFAAALAREAANVTLPGEAELVARVTSGFDDYTATSDRLLGAPGGLTSEAYFRELLPRFDLLRADVHSIRRINQAAMLAADERARAVARDSTRLALAVGLAALLLALWLASSLPRAIVRPVAALRDAAARAGEGLTTGEIAAPVQVPAVAELIPLAEAFNAMLARLRAYRESSLGELLAAQDLARSTIACLLDPVLVFDPGGSILLANEAAERVFDVTEGMTRDPGSAGVRLPGALLDAVDQAARDRLPVLPASLSQAIRHPGPDGERFFLVRAAPLGLLDAPSSAAPRVLVVAQDVTRFRRIDELKSNAVATVSHEFKTPLTSLRMATHLLLQPSLGPLNEAQLELVTTARDDTERLRLLVEKFLDLTRIEAEAGALRRVPLAPTRLLQAVAESHQALASARQVALEIDAPADLPEAPLDPDKMHIALANLVANAIQHTPSGGRVTLSVRVEGERLLLGVSDTGEGIQDDDLPHIFERFRRGHDVIEDRHRLGLGLAIAREVIRQHGGDVSVRSQRGQGAAFSLAIPLS